MTQYVDIQYIRNALGITGTKESCKGCKYNDQIGFACNTYKAPSFAYVCEVLDDAPTVDAEPVRHGKWIPSPTLDSRGFTDMFKCSECKRYSYYAYPVKCLNYKYCPYCGARMDLDNG